MLSRPLQIVFINSLVNKIFLNRDRSKLLQIYLRAWKFRKVLKGFYKSALKYFLCCDECG
jgi:hypothetical protein